MLPTPSPHHLDQILFRALPYVEQRRKVSGGYGATRRLPATIDDTYFALRIMTLLQLEPPEGITAPPSQDEALCCYLITAGNSLRLGISTRYHLLAAKRLIGLPVDTTATLAIILPLLKPNATLTTWFYVIAIIRDILSLNPATLIDTQDALPLLAQPWRTIDEARKRLFLQNTLGLMPDLSTANTLIAWIQACQGGDGGFGFMPGTTSFIENCRFAIEALDELGASPHDRSALIAFLCGCQTASGGFSRKGQATAFLDTTWFALAALVSALTPRPPKSQSP